MKRILLSALLLFAGSAHAATYYASPSGSGTTCSEGSPCTLAYAVDTKIVANDTLILNSGTYTTGIALTNASKHAGVTITTTAAVKSALGTFTRGIPSGTDNRPYLQNATVNVGNGVSNVVVEYLRVRGAASPQDSCYDGVVVISEYPTTLRYTEVWNGCQGVMIRTSREVLVQHVYSHDNGPIPSGYDEMCVLIVNWQADAASTSYATAVQIDNSTLARCSGDGVQENSYSETGNQFSYLILSNNDVYDNEEQGYDFKGTDYVKFYGNNIYGNGYGGISNNSAYGSTTNFEFYGNRIHDHNDFAVFNQGGGSSWSFYNNVIHDNVKAPQYNYFAVNLPGGSGAPIYGNTFYNNTDTSGTNQTGALETGSSGALVKNNIFYNNGTGANDYGAIYSGSTLTADYNYFYPAAQARGTNTVTTCYTTGNCAGFTNIAGSVFTLLSGSPAKDAGTTLSAPYNTDFTGGTRTGTFDLGAYEYGVGALLPGPGNPRWRPADAYHLWFAGVIWQ